MDRKNGYSQYNLDKRKRHFELKFSQLKRSELSDHPIHIDDSFRTKRKRHSDIYNQNDNITDNNNNNNKSTKGSASELSYITYKSSTNFSRIDSLMQLQQSLNHLKYDHESKIDLAGSLSKPTKQLKNKESNDQYFSNNNNNDNRNTIMNKYEISGTAIANSSKLLNQSKRSISSTPPIHHSNHSLDSSKQFKYELKTSLDQQTSQQRQQQSNTTSFDFELIKKKVDSLVMLSSSLLSSSPAVASYKKVDIKSPQEKYVYNKQEIEEVKVEEKEVVEKKIKEDDEIHKTNNSYLQKQDSISLPLQSYFEYGGLNDIYSSPSKSGSSNNNKNNHSHLSDHRKGYSYIQSPKLSSALLDGHIKTDIDDHINNNIQKEKSPIIQNTDNNNDQLNHLDIQKEKPTTTQNMDNHHHLLQSDKQKEISPMIQHADDIQKQRLTLINNNDDNDHQEDVYKNKNDKSDVHSKNYNKRSPALIQPIDNNNNNNTSSPKQPLNDILSPKQQETDKTNDEIDFTGHSKSPIIDHSPISSSNSNVHNNRMDNDNGFDFNDGNNGDYMDYNNDGQIDYPDNNLSSNIHEENYISSNDKKSHLVDKSLIASHGDDNIYITKNKIPPFNNSYYNNIPSTSKTMPVIISQPSTPELTGIGKLATSNKSPYPHPLSNYNGLFIENDNMDLEQDMEDEEDAIEKYHPINKDANMSKRFLDPLETRLSDQIPKYIIREMFESQIDEKLSATCISIIEQASDAYLNQLCHDLKAYADHAGRKDITSEDMKLLMSRQRLITDEKNLETLAHENLPRELWDEICVSALADNYLYPNL
ncbi:unnamed protein product [Cunninghamella blakesleeana]